MKKAFTLCLAILLILTLSACSSEPAGDGAEQEIVHPVDLSMEIIIDVDDAGDVFEGMAATDFIAEEGSTVLEATQLFCMSKDISLSLDKNGTYITEMGGLSEGDYTQTTGWVYEINGESPTVSAAEKIIEKDQKILWKYIDFSTETW